MAYAAFDGHGTSNLSELGMTSCDDLMDIATPDSFVDDVTVWDQPYTPLEGDVDNEFSGNVVSFTAGTSICTIRGDVTVEDLQAGDEIVAASGEIRTIVCIHQRLVNCARCIVPSEAWPVRVRAGAFGDVPARDLFVSPQHSVSVGEDEALVPITRLINGLSIASVPADTVTYWHIELDEHDTPVAEGVPAEGVLHYGTPPWRGTDQGGSGSPDAVDKSFGAAGRERRDDPFTADPGRPHQADLLLSS